MENSGAGSGENVCNDRKGESDDIIDLYRLSQTFAGIYLCTWSEGERDCKYS
jgi:hypothetical protein